MATKQEYQSKTSEKRESKGVDDFNVCHPDILNTIGNTPLVKLNHVIEDLQKLINVYAKLEYFNPGGSVKDRIGISIIENAERQGLLKPGGTIVEATSGNTGAGLALAAAVKGYSCIFVMPDKMSEEKVKFLRAFGARVIITPTAVPPDDPRSYYSVASRIVNETPNSILADQYHNPANPETHYLTTGPEIWRQTGGKIDAFVAGLGTGGTMTGVGRYLRERNPKIKLVGIDIEGSLLFDTWKMGKLPEDIYLKTYKLEGIGEDFIPSTLDLRILDEVVQVNDRDSFLMTRRLVREEGLFCGGSSGAAVSGLLKSEVIHTLESEANIVVLLPDSGGRYLSKVFDDNWMRENGFMVFTRTEQKVADVLLTRKIASLIMAHRNEQISTVVNLMKEHDISQVPVVDDEGKLIGIVTEVDLLDHLLHPTHVYDPSETISSIINPNVITVQPNASVESVMIALERGKVIAVTDGERPVGILTKIDIIDYLTQRI